MASRSICTIKFNKRYGAGSQRFGIERLAPKEILMEGINMKNIQISDELYDQVVQLANADQLSIETVVTALVSQQMIDRTRLEARAAQGSLEKFNRALDKVPAVEPDAFDRL